MNQSIYVEPTNLCQLKCPMCEGVERSRALSAHLQLGTLKNVLRSKYFSHVTFYITGEPLLYRYFDDALELMKNKVVKISTNGQILDKRVEALVRASVSLVIVAIDGLSQEVYEKYRVDGSFDRAIFGVRRLQKEKIKQGSPFPRVAMQYLRFEHNKHESNEEVVAFAYKHGFDSVYILSAYGEMKDKDVAGDTPGSPFRFHMDFTPPVAEKALRPKSLFQYHGLFVPPYMRFTPSSFHCFTPAVLCDGRVYNCCPAANQNKDLAVMNVNDAPLDDYLESDAYRNFLMGLLSPWGQRHCDMTRCDEIIGARPRYVAQNE